MLSTFEAVDSDEPRLDGEIPTKGNLSGIRIHPRVSRTFARFPGHRVNSTPVLRHLVR